MTTPQEAAKADTGSRETHRAATCDKDGRQRKVAERAVCGQGRLQNKELCKNPMVREQ